MPVGSLTPDGENQTVVDDPWLTQVDSSSESVQRASDVAADADVDADADTAAVCVSGACDAPNAMPSSVATKRSARSK